ncbi:unnamed protein product [Pieris macdunnoughi]|uniref:Uncharacterized protein n=1 Tax=Pieris macdunnoughi TaxID=345717 RepID=A0A821W3V2_9NEOP|nr:unnamed protein product [Pieris macdunnoughi]
MTLKFSPDATSTMQHHKHYCLEVSDNCSPTVDHCIIRSASVGALDEAMMQALEHDRNKWVHILTVRSSGLQQWADGATWTWGVRASGWN